MISRRKIYSVLAGFAALPFSQMLHVPFTKDQIRKAGILSLRRQLAQNALVEENLRHIARTGFDRCANGATCPLWREWYAADKEFHRGLEELVPLSDGAA